MGDLQEAKLGLTLEEAQCNLEQAIELCSKAGGVNIKGKSYTMVAARVEIFRKVFGVYGRFKIEDVFYQEPIITKKCTIELLIDKMGWVEFACGSSQERRDAGMINKTSLIENCETSCIGRALANLGIHGGEYSSANEVQGAIEQQGQLSSKRPPAPYPGAKKAIDAYQANLGMPSTAPSAKELEAFHKAAEAGIEEFRKHWRLSPQPVKDYLKRNKVILSELEDKARQKGSDFDVNEDVPQ